MRPIATAFTRPPSAFLALYSKTTVWIHDRDLRRLYPGWEPEIEGVALALSSRENPALE